MLTAISFNDMDTEEIISEIKSYCEKGLLNGRHFDVSYGSAGNILRAQNIHVEYGDVIFDQYSMRFHGFTYEHDDLSEHNIEYLQSLIGEIRKSINIDRNLF